MDVEGNPQPNGRRTFVHENPEVVGPFNVMMLIGDPLVTWAFTRDTQMSKLPLDVGEVKPPAVVVNGVALVPDPEELTVPPAFDWTSAIEPKQLEHRIRTTRIFFTGSWTPPKLSVC